MNIGYATAAALLDGNVLPEQFTPARLDADDIWSLIGVTDGASGRVAGRRRHHRAVPHRRRGDHPGRRRAIRSGSSRRTARPADPVTNDELVAKFHALADRVTSRERADAIERAVVGLEDLDDVNDLIDLLAAPVSGALD